MGLPQCLQRRRIRHSKFPQPKAWALRTTLPIRKAGNGPALVLLDGLVGLWTRKWSLGRVDGDWPRTLLHGYSAVRGFSDKTLVRNHDLQNDAVFLTLASSPVFDKANFRCLLIFPDHAYPSFIDVAFKALVYCEA